MKIQRFLGRLALVWFGCAAVLQAQLCTVEVRGEIFGATQGAPFRTDPGTPFTFSNTFDLDAEPLALGEGRAVYPTLSARLRVGASDFHLDPGVVVVWFGPPFSGFQFLSNNDEFTLEALLLSNRPFLPDGRLRADNFPAALFDANATLTTDASDFSWTALGYVDHYHAATGVPSPIPEPAATAVCGAVLLAVVVLWRQRTRAARAK